jgi:hypothetical protein
MTWERKGSAEPAVPGGGAEPTAAPQPGLQGCSGCLKGVIVVFAVLVAIVVAGAAGGAGRPSPGGGRPRCVDGSTLFSADEVGSAFRFCDDNGDGKFDRQILKR